MKVKFILSNEECNEDITITYSKDNEYIEKLKEFVKSLDKEYAVIELYKEDTRFYIEVDKILFFETESNKIIAHTIDDMYIAKYRLYELEDLLPSMFIRISKSTIVNTSKVYSVENNITSSGCVEFNGTHKTVYVSRRYNKELKNKLKEKRSKL